MEQTVQTEQPPPVVATSDYVLPDFAQLKQRHRTLMDQYLLALDAAALLTTENEKGWFTWRRGARLWVGSHIRARCLRIANLYTQAHQGCDEDDEEMAEWLTDKADATTRFAESLYSLRLPGAFALLPVALSLGAAIAKAPIAVFIALASLSGYFLFVPAMAVSTFRQKRDLLYPGARAEEKRRPRGAEYGDWNVYRAEKELFELFKDPAPREASADEGVQLVTGGVVFLLAIGLLLFVAVPQEKLDEYAALPFVSVVAGPLVGAVFGFLMRRFVTGQYSRREWR